MNASRREVQLLVALATLVIPFVVGWGIGALIGRIGRRWLRPLALVAVAALLLAPPFLRLPATWVSAYDHLMMGTIALAGAVLGRWARGIGARAWLINGGVVAAALVVLELYARSRPELLHRMNLPAAPRLVFSPESRDPRCRLFYPEVYHQTVADLVGDRRDSGPRPSRRILHIGDSLVHAAEVAGAERFTAVLESLRPGEQHINLSAGGIGPEGYYMLILKWIDAIRPDQVVLHVFLGNDIIQSNPRYPFCGGRPVTIVDGDRVELRCPTPLATMPIGFLWSFGPSPYALQVLARYSATAARLLDASEREMLRRTHGLLPEGWRTEDEERHTFKVEMYAIRDELARRRIPLTVVLIPTRWSLVLREPDDPFPAVREFALQVLREGGLQALDAWAFFEDALARRPGENLFYSPSVSNPHLDVLGHRLYAEWLSANALGATGAAR